MKLQTLILTFSLLAQLIMAQPADVQQITKYLDELLAEQFKPSEPGVTALVARKGEILYHKAFGMANMELNVPMQVDNVMRIGSITKQFTAIAILQLMEQGKLGLQDEITKFIPDYPTQGNKITIEHLLTHTSGIQSYTSMKDYGEKMGLDMSPKDMVDYFKNEPMEFTPGSKFNYNNSGYYLLGYIIEQITGKTYPEYLEENIFRPLGMSNTLYGSNQKIIRNRASAYSMGEQGYENSPPVSMTQPYAAGSIQSTVGDLFKWNQAVHSYKLVKKETLAKALTSYKLSDGKETRYGYGWEFAFVQERPAIEHGGAIPGFGTMAIYLPGEDVFVALFANCDCISTKDLTAKMAAIAIGHPYNATPITLDGSMLEGYTGIYENEAGEQRIITFTENQLYSQRGRNPKFAIHPYKKDRFFFDKALTTIEFVRNPNGEIEKIITHNRSGDEVWMKSNNPVILQSEIILEGSILDKYLGEYAITPAFTFVVTRSPEQLFVQATGQEQFEIYAEAETKFFAKVENAQFEFMKDDTGKVISAILKQGGREIEAKKIK